MTLSEEELKEARQPIASLISKSDKAQVKRVSGTWQYTMLRDNLKALHLAAALIDQRTDEANSLSCDDVQEALHSLVSMIKKTEKAQAKFLPGTSQHTLLRNRLKALRISEALIADLGGKEVRG